MLIKDLSIRTAIEQLDPTAGFELTEDNVLLNWNSSVRSQPTDEEIQILLDEITSLRQNLLDTEQELIELQSAQNEPTTIIGSNIASDTISSNVGGGSGGSGGGVGGY